MRYDIAVIGNDESAIEMLFAAAASHQRTIAILPESRHSSWIVAQALRRLVGNLLIDRNSARRHYFSSVATPRLLRRLIGSSLTEETNELVRMLERQGVEIQIGEAQFESPTELTVSSAATCSRSVIAANNVIISTGMRHTAMHRPLGLVPFHRPESLLCGVTLPERLSILGGGSFGAGLAALCSLFGVRTHLLARDNHSSAMVELARDSEVTIVQHPCEIGLAQDSTGLDQSVADVVDCRRALGFTEHLNLPRIGIEPDENGQLWCTSQFETWCSGVFGIGEVVGFSPETALRPLLQAERVMQRIAHPITRPHFLTRQIPAARV
ncbi:MAG: FAD-dependent oxidoreductase [Planctomycetaceae bacterium]|nr:FAD-dependent oxidoreductase [Planctomycetaceae bacterium]